MNQPFAVIIPDEAALTVPISASTELSKLYMHAMNQLDRLEQEIWTEEIRDEHDTVIRTITHYPHDYKWYLEYSRKIAADISKINATVEAKNIENKLKMMDIFMQTDEIPKEIKENFVASVIRKRVIDAEVEGACADKVKTNGSD